MASQVDRRIVIQYAGVSRKGLPAPISFRRWVYSALDNEQQSLGVRLVEEAEMAELNHTYRGKSGGTNVLSFPVSQEINAQSHWLGDVVICPVIAQRQATEQSKRLRNHLAHLTIHGVLHLRGFDHIEPKDAELMESMETRLLATHSIPNPYQ